MNGQTDEWIFLSIVNVLQSRRVSNSSPIKIKQVISQSKVKVSYDWLILLFQVNFRSRLTILYKLLRQFCKFGDYVIFTPKFILICNHGLKDQHTRKQIFFCQTIIFYCVSLNFFQIRYQYEKKFGISCEECRPGQPLNYC